MLPLVNTCSESRKHTILPRNHENFSETSHFFWRYFLLFWSFWGRMDVHIFSYLTFLSFLHHIRKNYQKCNISLVKCQIFLLFMKIFLGTRFLGSSENLDSEGGHTPYGGFWDSNWGFLCFRKTWKEIGSLLIEADTRLI